MFMTTYNHGFHVEFENGYTVSCQFDTSNACERYNPDVDNDSECEQLVTRSMDCEMAIWTNTGEYITPKIMKAIGIEPNGNEVQGYVTPEQFAKVAMYLAELKKNN